MLSMKEIIRESFSFKSPNEDRGKKVTFFGDDGKKEQFKFNCDEKDQIIVSQRVGDIWIKWQTSDVDGQPMNMENVLKFLSDQGYNRRNTRKGGNGK